jgi:hypothetical protein
MSLFPRSMRARVTRYEGTTCLESADAPFGEPFEFAGARWQTELRQSPAADREDAWDIEATFTLVSGRAVEHAAVSVQFDFEDWSTDAYVLMPSAAYNGNRFESRDIPYPPVLGPDDARPDCPTIITNVARLQIGPGPSRLQQLTRDLSTPAVAIHLPLSQTGFLLLTPQGTRLGDSLYDLEETDDRHRATLRYAAPGVREEAVHRMWKPYADRGANFETGDSLTLRFRVLAFPCEDVPTLTRRFLDARKDVTGSGEWVHDLPFSAAWQIQEEKFSTQNWNERNGYIACGTQQSNFGYWQLGWVGGLISTYPLLTDGTEDSREKVRRTFDFWTASQTDSGLFWPCHSGEHFHGDGFDQAHAENWFLMRRAGDALYFALKQFDAMKRLGVPVDARWEESARRLADRLSAIWDRYGEYGQFADVKTGELVVGNSASAGIAPAGMALAASYFGQPRYLEVASASARMLHERFVRKGYTTGGPGEAAQCPDSESADGIVESMVTLYEVTGDPAWLPLAREAADHAGTWRVSYDFEFPPESLFGRLGMRTTGAVYANVQNKHGAPGSCTLSNVALFKLWRATGDALYLELARETAHNLTQYLSRADRPVGGMPPGWMTERVNLSDWAEGVGEIFEGSCWCENSLTLTWAEVPGVYVQPDTGFIEVFDHVDASWRGDELWLTNPTRYPARVKLFAEPSASMGQPLGQNFLLGCPVVEVPPGGAVSTGICKKI